MICLDCPRPALRGETLCSLHRAIRDDERQDARDEMACAEMDERQEPPSNYGDDE